jgi:hypothetical protein
MKKEPVATLLDRAFPSDCLQHCRYQTPGVFSLHMPYGVHQTCVLHRNCTQYLSLPLSAPAALCIGFCISDADTVEEVYFLSLSPGQM